MNFNVLLQVLSWEERARILSKVWILGIILALIAVGVFLYFQRKKQKRARILQAKRKKTTKSNEVIQVELEEFLATDYIKKKGINLTLKKSDLVLLSKRGEHELCSLFLRKEGATKYYIVDLLKHEAAKDKSPSWILGKLKKKAEKNAIKSLHYYVQGDGNQNLIALLKNEGFKKIQLSKKEQEKGYYELKYKL